MDFHAICALIEARALSSETWRREGGAGTGSPESALENVMRAVAKRAVIRMFASAQIDRFAALGLEDGRHEFRTLVRSITKWLGG